MNYYVKSKFDLNTFEAWGGGKTRLDRIKELGAVDKAQNYIESKLFLQEQVTNEDINYLLCFKMNQFIKDMEEQLNDKIIEDYEITGITQGELWSVINGGLVELVTNNDDGYYIHYAKLDRGNIWTDAETNKLHILNRPMEKVSVFGVRDSRVILERIYQA